VAKRKKHQFHCEKCQSPCEIYKKGKKHRVLVCPKCGVIATNPLPLALIAALAPTIIEGVSSLISKPKSSKSERQTTEGGNLPTYKPRNTITKGERYVNLALGEK